MSQQVIVLQSTVRALLGVLDTASGEVLQKVPVDVPEAALDKLGEVGEAIRQKRTELQEQIDNGDDPGASGAGGG